MSYVGTKADLNSRNQSFMNQSPFTKASVNYRSIQEFNDKEEILWGLTQK